MSSGQQWDPASYARNARFVAELGESLIEWLAPRAGERVLDLGCGDGALSQRLVALGCRVTGVDASPAFVDAASAAGLDARVMDGQALAFAPEFDAVFSNAALHWMKDPDAVIDGVRRALLPGGRFVAEFGGRGNVASIVDALGTVLARRGIDARSLNPWYFPGPDEYRARLAAGGLDVRRIELFERPTPLPGAIEDWLKTFAGTFLAPLPEPERAGALDELRAALAPALQRDDGSWFADYVRLRVVAFRP